MTIKELMYNHSHPIFTDDKLLHGDLIVMDGKDGKNLFDTSRNKKN